MCDSDPVPKLDGQAGMSTMDHTHIRGLVTAVHLAVAFSTLN
jgi:hypothetical protein